MSEPIVWTLDERECAADALRRYEQGGKNLNLWESLPKATKQKWLAKVDCMLAAAQRERSRAVGSTS